MVDTEELSSGTSSEGELDKDQDILFSFFEYNGIEDFKDFMSFDKVDFNQPYSTLDEPDTLLSLFLSVKSWYGYMLQDATNDPVKDVYSLNVSTLNTWRSNEVAQRFSTTSSPPTAPITTSVPSPSQASPRFHSSIKINISDYPKLKDDNQWRTFNRQLQATAASHGTMDVLDPTYVPSLEDQDSFRKKQRFMYNVFSNIVLTTKGKNVSVMNAIQWTHKRSTLRFWKHTMIHFPLISVPINVVKNLLS
jgi:hypothetical protein